MLVRVRVTLNCWDCSAHVACICMQAAEMLLRKGLLSDGSLYRSSSPQNGSPTRPRSPSGGWQPAARALGTSGSSVSSHSANGSSQVVLDSLRTLLKQVCVPALLALWRRVGATWCVMSCEICALKLHSSCPHAATSFEIPGLTPLTAHLSRSESILRLPWHTAGST